MARAGNRRLNDPEDAYMKNVFNLIFKDRDLQHFHLSPAGLAYQRVNGEYCNPLDDIPYAVNYAPIL